MTKPFLKWAGGKTQLLERLHKLAPRDFNKYIEPFIGGGAMFFSLTNEKSIISDSNEELIVTYKEVKNNVDAVIKELSSYVHSEEFYYDIRSRNPLELDPTQRAARLIFLNKTCFNGLYRVNKKGQFNVPYGKGKGKFLNEVVLIMASERLKNAEIFLGDYESVLADYAEHGDFIFLDPPYHPISEYSDFKRYTKEFFYEEDQMKLSQTFISLVEKGCKVLLTNSDHPFILDLYKDFKVEIVETKRMINRNAQSRKGRDIIVVGE